MNAPVSTASSPAIAGQSFVCSGATVANTANTIVLVVTAGPMFSFGHSLSSAPTSAMTTAEYNPTTGGNPAMAAKAMHCGMDTSATVRPACTSPRMVVQLGLMG